MLFLDNKRHCMVVFYLSFKGNSAMSFTVALSLPTTTANRAPLTPYPSMHLLSVVFSQFDWYDKGQLNILICISQTTKDIEQFLKCFWPLEFILWKIVYSVHNQFINWMSWVRGIENIQFFIYSTYYSLMSYIYLTIFFHSVSCLLTSAL